MKQILSFKNDLPVKILISLASLTLIAILTKSTHILGGTDDAVLSKLMHSFTVWTWIPHQYSIWSGRVTAESMIVIIYNLPIWIWKILQIGIFAVLICTLYAYYALVANRIRTRAIDISMYVICAFSPLLLDVGALRWGAFWITGSLNYLWIAVFALVGFYPLLYTYIRRTSPPWYLQALGIIFSVLAALGQEQVYLILSLFSIYTTVTLSYKTKKLWLYPTIQTAATFIAAIISYAAPGNRHRLSAEMQTYIPNFHTAPLLERINWSYHWIIDALINHSGYLLPLLWIIIIALLMIPGKVNRVNRKWLSRWIILLLLIGTILLCRVIPIVAPTNFYVAWGVKGLPFVSYLYLLFWTIVLFATLVGLYEVGERYSENKLFLPLVFVGVIVGASAMVLSPTMYASGPRTMLIPAMLLLVLVNVLMAYVLKEYRKQRVVFIGIVITGALLTFLSLSAALQGLQA